AVTRCRERSHSDIVLSLKVVARVWPSGLKATWLADAVSPSVAALRRGAVFHNCAPGSAGAKAVAGARGRPSGLRASAPAVAARPPIARRVRTSQNLTPSLAAVATVRPSGENAMAVSESPRWSRTARGRRAVTLHSLAVPSSLPATTARPSG